MRKSGIDFSRVDSTIRPQDDFYRHVNGTWLKEFELPKDKSRYATFTVLREKAREDVKNIIMCGTNLAGCILKGKETSAINLIKRGFNVVLYLPACAEEEAPGTVSIQKMFHGIEGMYDIIKSQYLIDKLDMAASHNRLSAKFF